MEKEEVKKTEYFEVGKSPDQKFAIPSELKPTNKTGWIFSFLFILVVVIGIIRFPFSSLLAGNIDVTIEIGLPWSFLEFDLNNPEETPVKFGSLILDLVLYLIIAYLLDVVINVFMKSFSAKKIKKSEQESVELYKT